MRPFVVMRPPPFKKKSFKKHKNEKSHTFKNWIKLIFSLHSFEAEIYDPVKHVTIGAKTLI